MTTLLYKYQRPLQAMLLVVFLCSFFAISFAGVPASAKVPKNDKDPAAPQSDLLKNLGSAGKGMGSADAAGAPKKDLATIIGSVIKMVLALLGVILLILVVYGGIMWMTAGGNPEDVTKAKNLLQNAVIGIGITLAAYAITHFVVINLTEAAGM